MFQNLFLMTVVSLDLQRTLSCNVMELKVKHKPKYRHEGLPWFYCLVSTGAATWV